MCFRSISSHHSRHNTVRKFLWWADCSASNWLQAAAALMSQDAKFEIRIAETLISSGFPGTRKEMAFNSLFFSINGKCETFFFFIGETVQTSFKFQSCDSQGGRSTGVTRQLSIRPRTPEQFRSNTVPLPLRCVRVHTQIFLFIFPTFCTSDRYWKYSFHQCISRMYVIMQ